MMTCESCREQVLQYLYDLLEPEERQLFSAHVETCAACQEALNAARDQMGLLAEAVKPGRSTIVFAPPAGPSAPPKAPVLLPARSWRGALFNRWSIAASILFLVIAFGGGLGAALWHEHNHALAGARDRLAEAQNRLQKSEAELKTRQDQTQQEIRAIQKQIDAVINQWKQEEATKRKVLEKERVQLIIKGPRVAQAGAPNRYDVEMRLEGDGNSRPQDPPFKGQQTQNFAQQLPGMMPPLQARVVNQKTQEILYEKMLHLQENNRANFDLPTELPIKPGDDLAIEFWARNDEGKLVSLRDNLKVVFPEYVTHLTTDRPLYRPGETVRFRSLTLERFSLKPADRDFHLRYRIVDSGNRTIYAKEFASRVVSDTDNKPIQGPDGRPIRGVGVGEFTLPTELDEGYYTLSVVELNERFNEEKRTFLVRRAQAPRFGKEVTFHRVAYSPGDSVQVRVSVRPLPGLAAEGRGNIQILAYAQVDGQSIPVDVRREATGAEANATLSFVLPADLAQGVGALTLRCDDGSGKFDTTVRKIPIELRDVNVDFYPEGGDLIAGVPNRVYFHARTRADQPVSCEGVILDEQKTEVARIRTLADDREPGLNQGMGSFSFTPLFRKKYSLRITSPFGVDRLIPLPPVKDRGVALHAPQGVVEDHFDLIIHSARQPRYLLVGAYCRGRMLDHKFVLANANQPTPVRLKPQSQAGGVYRITVFEKKREAGQVYYDPVAERLAYRKSKGRVDVAIESARARQFPGEAVELHLQAKNERNEPVPAVALVGVLDANVRRRADDRFARSMPTHFLLTTEINHPESLENADVLLSSHPQAGAALDLLLGCQGWRRFAEQDPMQFAQRQPQAAGNFLANSVSVPQFLEAEQKQIEKLDQGFAEKAIKLNRELAKVEAQESGPADLLQQVESMQAKLQESQGEIDEINRRLREARGFLYQFSLGGGMLGALFLGFLLISIGLRRLTEGGDARPWLLIGLALVALLFVVSIIGTFILIGRPPDDDMHFQHRFAKVKPFAPMPPPVKKEMPGAAVLPFSSDEMLEGEMSPELAEGNAGKKQPPAQPIFNQDEVPERPPWGNDLQNPQGEFPAAPADRVLRREGNYQLLLQRQLGRPVQLPPANDPCVVREYAHRRAPQKDDAWFDATENVYWNPVVIMPDGKGKVSFDLSDAVTRYEVVVLSHTLQGTLGANRAEIVAQLPYQLQARSPVEVCAGDRIGIPVSVKNVTLGDVSGGVWGQFKGLSLEGNAKRSLDLKPAETQREIFHVSPTIQTGDAALRIVGRAGRHSEGTDLKFHVVPGGFPVAGSVSGVLENHGSVDHAIDLPDEWIKGTLQIHAHFYPSLIAELESAREAMLQTPAACLEQQLALAHVNAMLLRQLRNADLLLPPNPLAEKQARRQMESIFRKAATFECVEPGKRNGERGYDWFGSAAPPHPGLSALALMRFHAMAALQSVDTDVLRRTEQYLLDQRDGKGGFRRGAGDSVKRDRAADVVTDATIVWALTQTGANDGLDAELAVLREECKTRKDPYLLALVAMSHLNRKEIEEGLAIVRELRAHQRKDGKLAGAQRSVTGSRGRDLEIETTALGILAWLQADRPAEFQTHIRDAVRWLGQQRRGLGVYGGTQATTLALQAMEAHARRNPRRVLAGEVSMSLQDVGAFAGGMTPAFERAHATFNSNARDTITLQLRDVAALQRGRNVVTLNITGNNAMPYTLTWTYHTLKPASVAKAPVTIKTSLSNEQAVEGGTVRLKAEIENVSGKEQGMTVAVISLPAGLALPEDSRQLSSLVEKHKGGKFTGTISAWELRGRDLVLYWRALSPGAKIDVELDLTCRFPGAYRGPASRVYAYYDADRSSWSTPLNLRIDEAK